MFRKLTDSVLQLRQREHTTSSTVDDKKPETVKLRSLQAAPSLPLAGLEAFSSRQSTDKSTENPSGPPSEWGTEVRAALDSVGRPGVKSDPARVPGFTVTRQPPGRPATPLDTSKPKPLPKSLTGKTKQPDTPEIPHVPAVVATPTLHKTGHAPVARTAKTADTTRTPLPGDHVEALGRAFDTFFPEADTHDTHDTTVDTPPAEPPPALTANTPRVADVPHEAHLEQREQLSGANRNLGRWLGDNAMEPIENSGKGNNCAIYSLVQCAAPTLKGKALDDTVGQIRARFDRNHPNETGQMLLLDSNTGGHGPELVSLVNETCGVDMQVGVIQPGIEEGHAFTAIGRFRGSAPPPEHAQQLRVAVWDKQGHFEAIIGKQEEKAAETGSDAAKQKAAPLSDGKGTTSTPQDTKPVATTKTKTPNEEGKKAADTGRNTTRQRSASLPTYLDTSRIDDRQPEKKPDGASTRPHGEALARLVPNPSRGAKAFRRFGRWIRVDNENAVPQLLNRTKPEGGIVQGLSKAHMGTMVPSGLQLAHEGVNTIYAAQELGSSAMRQSRYQKRLSQWPASDGEPTIRTDGADVPLSEIAKKTDFQSRYDLKVAILARPEEAPEREAMLDVLTGRYIAEVQGKNRVVRAALRTAAAVTGVGAGTGLAVATHGGSIAAAIAGGAILSSRDVLDNRKAAHSLKQHYRDKKMAAIIDEAMRYRVENHLEGEPGEAEKANWDNVRNGVNQQRIKRFLPVKYKTFDEKKSTDNKKQEVDLVKKHAAARVAGAIDECNSRHSLERVYRENNGVRKKELKQFYREAVDVDRREDGGSDIAASLQLMRDLGMSKMEAISHLRTATGGSFAKQKIDDDQKKRMKDDADPIVREMALSPGERLESAIGSAMGRR
jgi:hypothetical protein